MVTGRRIFAALCCALLAAVAHAADEAPKPRGAVSITVTDKDGTAVKDAAIKAVRIGDAQAAEGKSGADGTCKLDLEIGTYCFTVRAANFGPDFTGGVTVRAKTDLPLHFMLYPGNPATKLPYEKTPAERAAEADDERKKRGEPPVAAAQEVLKTTYEGLDATCKDLGIERTNGGPAMRTALVKTALELAGKADYQGALEKYRQAVGEDASDPLSWFNMGVLYGVQKQAKNSERCFRTAIGLCGGGGEADYHSYLGRALGTQGRFEESEKEFGIAIGLEPKHEGQYLYELACSYHALRMFDKSAPLFAKAIQKGCDDLAVYFAYGNALEMQGKKAEALAQYKNFVKFADDDTELQGYVLRAKQKIEALGK